MDRSADPLGDQGVHVAAKLVPYGHSLRPHGGFVAHLRGLLQSGTSISYWMIIKRRLVGPTGGPWAPSGSRRGSSGDQGVHVVAKLVAYGHPLRPLGGFVDYLRGFLQSVTSISYWMII